jgi:nucleotide-binding universal stress UspA family protein
MTFQKILFPIDFSNRCEQIAPAVASMRDVMGASLAILHSIDIDRSWFTEESRKSAEERLKSFAATHFPKSHPELVLDNGEPAGAIARCIESRQIDLVMMPTHGHGTFRRALLGSVTTKVLHDVNCALWTAPHAGTVHANGVKRILCALEDPVSSADLLRSATGLGKTLGAVLSIVHAYPDFAGTPAERYQRKVPRTAEIDIRRKMDTLQMSVGTSLPVVIAGGEVNDVIAETARRGGADLVIVARGSFGGFLDTIRSHLYFIIRSSPCPVLVLPE